MNLFLYPRDFFATMPRDSFMPRSLSFGLSPAKFNATPRKRTVRPRRRRRLWALVGVAVALALFMVLGIGLSRVALGVHYVSDVIAGFALGAAWVAVMIAS